MFLDFERDALPRHAPYVVVGSGPVGLVLAITLARQKRGVLVVETGGRSFETSAAALNSCLVIGRPHIGALEGRARLFGGNSSLWGGQLTKFTPSDLCGRPWVEAKPWPVSYEDIDRQYSAVAQLLGLESAISDEQVWRDLGAKAPDLSSEFSVILTRWLKEPNLAKYFEQEARQAPNLTFALHASCTGIEFSESGQRVNAVTVRSQSGKRAQIGADTVILANGTLEAVRLMLIAAREGLAPWRSNRWIGRGFQDHLDVNAADVEVLDRRRFHDAFDNVIHKGAKYQPKIVSSHSFQEMEKSTNIAASFVADSAIGEHVARLKVAMRSIARGVMPDRINDLGSSLAGTMRVWWPLMVRYVRDNRIMQVADRGIKLRLHCEQVPLATSAISLSNTQTDAFGSPLLVLDWRVDGRELDGMHSFAEHLSKALEARGLARLKVDPRLVAREQGFLDECRDTFHQCGGLRMSLNPSEGVTDKNLKVHGCDNLYIAGAAVFPSASFANPTFTAMALALRLVGQLSA